MMTTSTRVEDAVIAGLLERVTAATGPDRVLDLDLARALVPDVVVLRRNDDDTANEPHTYWEYTTSIDAALALVERMLPGWRLGLYQMAGHWQASLAEVDEETDLAIDDYFADGPTAPLAILAALLKSLRSLSQGAGHEQ